MDDLALRLRARLLPALLTALGVAFLTAGLLSYTSPVEAGPESSELPTIMTLPPTAEPSVTPRPSQGPDATPDATPAPTIPSDRVATRVVISALGIDLPIIRQETTKVPCNVAMYYDNEGLGQPGEGRATYIYAHAREGMFLPLLDASKVENGKKMLGMIVEVYTSDDQLFLYEITEVRRHVAFDSGLLDPMAATQEELWLQTSEGVGKAPKLQLVARLLSQGSADDEQAHPKPNPIICT